MEAEGNKNESSETGAWQLLKTPAVEEFSHLYFLMFPLCGVQVTDVVCWAADISLYLGRQLCTEDWIHPAWNHLAAQYLKGECRERTGQDS